MDKYSDCCESVLLEQETLMCSSCKEHCDIVKRYFVDLSSLEVYAKNQNEAWDKAWDMYQNGSILSEIELSCIEEW
jgi:hypothetical protein